MVIDPETLIPVGIYALVYGLLVVHRWRASRRFDWRRACSYAAGLIVVVVALDSELDDLADHGSLVAHMAQHELIGNIVPVLLLLGLDAALWRPITQSVFGPIIRRPRWRRGLYAANSPVLAVALYIGVMWLWYVPAVYARVSPSPVLHPIGHLLFVLTGLLFWFHVLRPLPALQTLTPWRKLAYLLAGTLGGAVVAAFLVGAPHALYDASLRNQRLAGAVMMAVEMPLAVGAALWVFLRAVPRGALRLPAERYPPANGLLNPSSRAAPSSGR